MANVLKFEAVIILNKSGSDRTKKKINDQCRSSRLDVFWKKGVVRNFVKFTGKHLCQSLFFDKIAGLIPATLLKKRLWQRCFAVNFAKILRSRNTFSYRTPPVAAYMCMQKVKLKWILVSFSNAYVG